MIELSNNGQSVVRQCSYKKHFKPIERFSLNDYGKPVSTCMDCMNEKSIERYYRNKNAAGNSSTERCTSIGEAKETA